MSDVGGSSTGWEEIGKHLQRQKGKGVETENICDIEGLHWLWSKEAWKNWNVQVNRSTWDLMCIVTHSLTWMSYLSWQLLLKYRWDYFFHFEQQQRGSAHWHALSLISHGDASDGEDILVDEWDWRIMLENDDGHCTTSDNYELVTYYTCELIVIIVIIVLVFGCIITVI